MLGDFRDKAAGFFELGHEGLNNPVSFPFQVGFPIIGFWFPAVSVATGI